jgi:hypothetical protein
MLGIRILAPTTARERRLYRGTTRGHLDCRDQRLEKLFETATKRSMYNYPCEKPHLSKTPPGALH